LTLEGGGHFAFHATMTKARGTVGFVFVGMVLVGCRKPQGDGTPTAAASAAEPVAKAAPVIDAAPAKPVTATRSVAGFVSNTLDECLDLTIVAPAGVEQTRVDKAADDVAAKAIKHGKADGKGALLPISQPCLEQFKDRTSLGSCAISQTEKGDSGVQSTILIEAFYFNVKTMNDDGYMKDCLTSGGKWTAPAKDDRDAARERLRQRAKALQDLADKMNAAQE
jgi:hypothetical protein